jgi:flavin-binding protein dodecin
MAVAKILEITASSGTSFEEAVQAGVSKASETVHGITGAWVKDQEVRIADGQISEYRVNLKITFLLD